MTGNPPRAITQPRDRQFRWHRNPLAVALTQNLRRPGGNLLAANRKDARVVIAQPLLKQGERFAATPGAAAIVIARDDARRRSCLRICSSYPLQHALATGDLRSL